jgi:preprotein translocase subunit SecD
LGLLLLGVLAQVSKAVNDLIDSLDVPEGNSQTEETDEGRVAEPGTRATHPAANDPASDHDDLLEMHDLGVAVARNRNQPTTESSNRTVTTGQKVIERSDLPSEKQSRVQKKRRRKGGDEFDDLFSALM